MPGFDICQAVGAPNLKIQIGLYHLQVMEGDLETKLKRYASECRHAQIAGWPVRDKLETGEVRYDRLYRVLDQLAYAGWVRCE
jgi:hydroxypyruvate isomerase